MNFNQKILIVFHQNGTIFKNNCNFTENLVEIYCKKPNVVENWAFLYQKLELSEPKNRTFYNRNR